MKKLSTFSKEDQFVDFPKKIHHIYGLGCGMSVVSKHDDIKIRTHDFYNPDYILMNGTWLEVTLSENNTYKKLFRYGHQAPL